MINKYKRGVKKYRFALLFLLLMILMLWQSCNKNSGTPVVYNPPPALASLNANVSLQWADLTLYTIRFSAFNTPTYASRSLGYLGVAMYESVVAGDAGKKSLNGQLTGLSLPQAQADEKYQWTLSLNAAEDTLLKLLYPVPKNSHAFIHHKIDSLYAKIFAEQSKNIDPVIVDRSVQFGQAIALAIYNWSVTDGGDKGYTRNFEPSFVFPAGDSYWVPPSFGQTVSPYPLHPHWGDTRPFVKADGEIPVPAIVPFSTDTGSVYYHLYKDVYDKNRVLTSQEMNIAAWWSDDPTQTFSPPGHSYYLASVAVKKSNASLVKAAESFARTGIAVADAFIHCWKAKYTYFNERPSTYVNKFIDSRWIQFWPEPPFPAFPSGHSIQSAAAATVLTALYGEPFPFTDSVFVGEYRSPYYSPLSARSFNSFWDAANECAYSRFLGGIHTKQDNEVGASDGRKVGNNVNALQWDK